jgi:hypothetical protein
MRWRGKRTPSQFGANSRAEKVLGGSKNQEMKRRRTIQSEGRVPVIMVHELVGRVSVMDAMSLLSPSSGCDGRAGAQYRKFRGRQPPRSQMLGRPFVCLSDGRNNWAGEEGGRVRWMRGWDRKRSNAVARGESDEEAFLQPRVPRYPIPKGSPGAGFALRAGPPRFFWLPQASAKTPTNDQKSYDGRVGQTRDMQST